MPSSPSSEDLSETALLTSLFGWTIAPPLPSLTRAASARASSRAPSRASSVAPSAPSSPTRAPSRAQTPSRLSVPPTLTSAKQDALLHCPLCQRRVGLWAFGPRGDLSASSRTPPRRPFDLLKEHRSYCPYVVRSTVIPSLNQNARSTSSTISLNGQGELEGWRAVLSVLLRYGMAQRSQLSGRRVEEGEEGRPESGTDFDSGVNAMVEGVKARGVRLYPCYIDIYPLTGIQGKDLLRYVKGLLG